MDVLFAMSVQKELLLRRPDLADDIVLDGATPMVKLNLGDGRWVLAARVEIRSRSQWIAVSPDADYIPMPPVTATDYVDWMVGERQRLTGMP